MSRIKREFLSLIPGLALAAVIGVVAFEAHRLYKPLSGVAVAMIIGLLIRNLASVPYRCEVGVQFAARRILRLAIVLLGVRLSFLEVLKIGGSSLIIVISCIVIALVLVQVFSRLLKIPPRLGTLIGVGSCICGNSAIAAVAPVIEAEDEDVSFAVATITLFGMLAVLVYPIIGNLLHMSDVCFGTWSGTAINDTSQVTAAGFIFSKAAGETAMVVKMTRNLFIAPVIIIMGCIYHRKNSGATMSGKISWQKSIPMFVIGFVCMAILRTFGVFPGWAIASLKTASSFLIIVAIAGVGMSTGFSSMKKTGFKPFLVGVLVSVLMGTVSYTMIKILGIG
jgi:uncharacterized integral membrane protein (TIGR00698 family)